MGLRRMTGSRRRVISLILNGTEVMKKQHLPGVRELILFAVVALICGLIATSVAHSSRDTALTLMVFPIFLSCAILGLYRSGRLRRIDDQQLD